MHFSGLLFFLTTLEAGASAFILAMTFFSIFTKQDSRCRHTYVYIVHKVLLLGTTLQAFYAKNTLIKKWQRAFCRRFTGRINYFWTFLWQTSNLILRPIKQSSLKMKKSKWYSCRSFEIKEWWGMHSNVVVLKFKSNESELAKKKCTFLDYFFFNRSLNLVHLYIFWPWLQYSFEARFTMLTYVCIHCSQSFTHEHYFVDSLFKRYISRKATKGIF